ncbi:MAG TPA: glycosyl hydrolase 115 family protein [Actinophytocola sp.]|uniref:glycosyl hydrolase 115 family protein n=1 Tax=Actinophytocola sp. TaxID=1872138 RepID=UPI002E01AE87|nr:glycosyl hydrolase 115 family protein [Actinophytocola sp.]
MRRSLALLVPSLLATTLAPAMTAVATGDHGQADPAQYVVTTPRPGSFALVERGKAAPLVVSAADHPGVVRVVDDLQADVNRVTGAQPAISTNQVPARSEPVIIGTIGRSPLIDGLISAGKLDVRGIAGKWETSLEQVVQNPLPGIRRAFVIAGSDQRGTIYGAYDVSKQIGVSPWYFWNDVPAKHADALHVLPGRHTQGTPVVKYRGFFINDEAPNLGTWAPAFFGPGKAPGIPWGFNANFYAKIFEVMLRLKANYLWPAVWGRAFAEDDPQNHATATEYGVIMGTSHEAPMMRGIEEWNRHARAAVRDSNGNIVTPGTDPYGGTGEWSFRRNADAIQAYWTDGIRRMVDESFEGVVTLGMRGNGDVSLPDGDGIELMQSIIANERRILGDVTGKDVTTIPQVWTLYKEVQRYWDRGLRAPDDVTVVFTDDNWGNMRKLPDPSLPARSGGYGMYYHFDYVGGGRNYKWVDTINLANTWEQLHAAYSYGIDRLWVFNVGDMKGEELPLQFSLDTAWNPAAMTPDKLPAWEKRYAAENFGGEHAESIADVLHDYGALQGRRKPELLNRRITVDPANPNNITYDDQGNPFSLENYREMDRATADWARLAERADQIGRALPPSYQDAYYELVLYAVKATANLYALRNAEFTNIRYARQGRAATNDVAATAEARFADDLALADHYNHGIAGGKWNNFQLQPHIDYGDVARYGPNAPWQQPELNNAVLPDVIFPALQRIEVPSTADMGVAVDGSDKWWPAEPAPALLPTFSPYQSQPAQYVEVFNRGTTAFDYRIEAAAPYVRVWPNRGTVTKQVRATVFVDWSRAPRGTTQVPITITGPNGSSVVVQAVVQNPDLSRSPRGTFAEANGYVSMLAQHATRTTGNWLRIPDIGRDGDGMLPSPVTAPRVTPGGDTPHLDFTMNLTTTGPVTVWAYLSPRNNVHPTDGLSYAVSVDGAPPQVVNVTTATGANDTTMNRQWETNTSNNVNRTATTHQIDTPGVHTLRFWMVDPTVILQKLVVDTGGLRPSYLGPPESRRF